MKRLRILLSILAFSLALSSCDAIYTYNLFRGMDPSTASAEDLAAMSLDELDDNARSDHWVEDVSSDPEALEAAQGNLEDIIADPEAEPEQIQVAVEVWTTLELASSGAGQLISGVFENIQALADASAAAQDPATADQGTADFLDALFPESFPDQESFTELILTMMSSAEMYETLAGTIGVTYDEAGAPIYSAPAAGVNPGELAQNALVCLLVQDIAIKDPATGEPVPGSSPEEIAAALWTQMDDDPDNDVSVLFVVPDFSDPEAPLSLIMGQAGLDPATFVVTEGE